MKKTGKTLPVFCSILIAMSMFAGCGGGIKEEVQEETAEIEQEAEEVAQEAEEQTEAALQAEASAGSGAKEIGEDAALKIALKDAGLSKSDVSRIQCELDYDDGRTEYEIEFHKGMTEYSYTLDAFSGKILEKEIDNDDD